MCGTVISEWDVGGKSVAIERSIVLYFAKAMLQCSTVASKEFPLSHHSLSEFHDPFGSLCDTFHGFSGESSSSSMASSSSGCLRR